MIFLASVSDGWTVQKPTAFRHTVGGIETVSDITTDDDVGCNGCGRWQRQRRRH